MWVTYDHSFRISEWHNHTTIYCRTEMLHHPGGANVLMFTATVTPTFWQLTPNYKDSNNYEVPVSIRLKSQEQLQNKAQCCTSYHGDHWFVGVQCENHEMTSQTIVSPATMKHEQLYIILTQTEAVLNSHPFMPLSIPQIFLSCWPSTFRSRFTNFNPEPNLGLFHKKSLPTGNYFSIWFTFLEKIV
jgi:hypothetical protein